MLAELKTDYEHADALVNILIDRATGGDINEYEYTQLRNYFVADNRFADLLPKWFASKRSVNQFWQFIKNKYGTYSERREFIWSEFERLRSFCECDNGVCAEPVITSGLEKLDSNGVNRAWAKALKRIENDPEGAITLGRTLLESVCKHILDLRGIKYKSKNIKLHQLYRTVAEELKLAPEQHDEDLFKQVLGGCSAVVNGLGSLRNSLGDAHGPGVLHVRPQPRHARLVVNIAGAMTLFLIETANK